MDAMDKMDNQELISALADGQLRGEAFARAVEVASTGAGARASWCTYHLVGEVLRTGRTNACTPQEDFLARLQQRLQVEQQQPAPATALVAPPAREAANDWVWKLTAGVASVAAVAAVGWNMWGSAGSGAAQPQLAAAPGGQGAVIEVSATPMMRDPGLDRLLAAHRQFGGGTAIGASSSFVRNTTFEAPSR